jgi:hypothetical protein
MSSLSYEVVNARKRKPSTKITERVVSSNDYHIPKRSKTCEVSPSKTKAAVKTERASTTNAASTSDAAPEKMLQRIGKTIRDLFHPDNAKVLAALHALCADIKMDKNNREHVVTVGGCFALIRHVKNCLQTAIGKIPKCEQVTKLNELPELNTLNESLNVIKTLADLHPASTFGITAIGGVEAVVKVMKVFPKCASLQSSAARLLVQLTSSNITGKNIAVETGGIQILLAAVNNHLGSAEICRHAFWALDNMVEGSKQENTALMVSLGGTAAVDKVRTKWRDNGKVQEQVRRLLACIISQLKTWRT